MFNGEDAPPSFQREEKEAEPAPPISQVATQIYTISYLVFFSILGALARLGLQSLTAYDDAPLLFPSAWPNFAGCLVMGFLAQDRKLFGHEWGASPPPSDDEAASGSSGNSTPSEADIVAAAKKAHAAVKKTIPLYIGLATGFCGSFTSFSSFIRDVFLAVADANQNGGSRLMSTTAVLIITMALSLSAVSVGGHLAIALESHVPSLPFHLTRRFADRLAVFLAFGCWTGVVLLAVLPPDRARTTPETEAWRGRAATAICLAPLGCLSRFYLSLRLNGKNSKFPLGTFVANLVGTAVLGAAWNLQHAPVGGVGGCQAWQGVMDGFCGCLTTVSTFAAELKGLQRKKYAYVYGGTSVVAAFAVLTIIMGGLRWSDGFAEPLCLR